MSKHDAKRSAVRRKGAVQPKAAVEGPEPDWIDETSAGAGIRAAGRTSPRKKTKTILLTIFIVLAALIILAEAAILIFGHFYSKLNYEQAVSESERAAASVALIDDEEELPAGAENATDAEISDMQAMIQEQLAKNGGSKMSDEDVINILLIGTDARERNEIARSDVMMLASLNKKTHKIVLTSFMRDTYTYIPGYGYNRLNAPFALGGTTVGERAGLLIDTLEADFSVNIDNYAVVNFYDFANIIDAIGGIDIPVTNAEVDQINEQVFGEQAYLGIGEGTAWLEYTNGGVAHLNGSQALAHCRNRHSSGSDYDRTERQRTVIAAALEKAKSLSLSELYDLADVVLPMVTTDLSQGDCLSLLLSSGEYLGYEVETLRIPAVDYSDAYINGMSVLRVDFASNAAILQDAIYGS